MQIITIIMHVVHNNIHVKLNLIRYRPSKIQILLMKSYGELVAKYTVDPLWNNVATLSSDDEVHYKVMMMVTIMSPLGQFVGNVIGY